MIKKLCVILCFAMPLSYFATAAATPLPFGQGPYEFATYQFLGQELSSGQSVNGSFTFVVAGEPSVYVSGGGGFAHVDVDRFFLAEAHLEYQDDRYMNYFQDGQCMDTIGGEVAGSFVRSTPCSPTLAPELGFSLDVDLGFLVGYQNSSLSFDVLMAQIFGGQSIGIKGRYGCSGGQLSPGDPADFGLTGSCGGSSGNLWGSYTGTLTAVDVPEPGTLSLLGLGLAAFGFARRRKQG